MPDPWSPEVSPQRSDRERLPVIYPLAPDEEKEIKDTPLRNRQSAMFSVTNPPLLPSEEPVISNSPINMVHEKQDVPLCVVVRSRPESASEIRKRCVPVVELAEDGQTILLYDPVDVRRSIFQDRDSRIIVPSRYDSESNKIIADLDMIGKKRRYTKNDDLMLKKARRKEKRFVVDKAFGPSSTQDIIYQHSVRPLLSSVLEGINCSVFAYGATGSGKTYTMLGELPAFPGCMVLALKELFTMMDNANQLFVVSACFIEIYCEKINDLINPTAELLELREDPMRGLAVAGSTTVCLKNVNDAIRILNRGNRNRTTESTSQNAHSSRSHAILQITVSQRAANGGDYKVSKLSLVDLAGSERAKVSGNVGLRMVEGANINRSLLALGNCINALCNPGLIDAPKRKSAFRFANRRIPKDRDSGGRLVEKPGGKKPPKGDDKYVPYRDSKLTRLLKDSLGGNSKTVMIATISPASDCYEDTSNTLKYAVRARTIRNKAVQNRISGDLQTQQYKELVGQLRGEIASLKAQLQKSQEIVPKQSHRESDPSFQILRERFLSVFKERLELQKELSDNIFSTPRVTHHKRLTVSEISRSPLEDPLSIPNNLRMSIVANEKAYRSIESDMGMLLSSMPGNINEVSIRVQWLEAANVELEQEREMHRQALEMRDHEIRRLMQEAQMKEKAMKKLSSSLEFPLISKPTKAVVNTPMVNTPPVHQDIPALPELSQARNQARRTAQKEREEAQRQKAAETRERMQERRNRVRIPVPPLVEKSKIPGPRYKGRARKQSIENSNQNSYNHSNQNVSRRDNVVSQSTTDLERKLEDLEKMAGRKTYVT